MTPTNTLRTNAGLEDTESEVAPPLSAALAKVFSVLAVYGLCSLALLQAQLFGGRSFIACCDASI